MRRPSWVLDPADADDLRIPPLPYCDPLGGTLWETGSMAVM